MRTSILACIKILTLSLLTIYSLSAQESEIPYSKLVDTAINPDSIDYETLNTALLRATNQYRLQHQLDSLSPDKHLAKAAGIQAEYLRHQKKLAHLNYRSNNLKTPAMRVTSTGVDMLAVGENLARMSIYRLGKNGQFFVDGNGVALDADGQPLATLTYKELAEQVTKGWYESKGHRENLLGDYTHIGMAERTMQTGNEFLIELVLVQNFGKY